MKRTKVDVPNVDTYLNRTHVFEWYMAKCVSKNGYEKDTCLRKIGVCAQNVMIILVGS